MRAGAAIRGKNSAGRVLFVSAAAAGLACALCAGAQAQVTYLAAPAVTAIAPAGGTIAGGTKVTIAGANFGEVKGVSFGQTPAVSFKVESESRIAAVSPASGTIGDTSVTVTTAAGNAGGTFTYQGCLVPRLRGVGLRKAKALLHKAGCGVGKLRTTKGKAARKGRVLRQSARPATVLVPGAKVDLTLG
jgi:hypothetical protein